MVQSRSPARILAVFAGLAALAGCASSGDAGVDAPAWYKDRVAKARADGVYPDLTKVPAATPDARSDQDWAAAAADLAAAGAALQADPRARPADVGDLGSFEDEARQAVGVTPPKP